MTATATIEVSEAVPCPLCGTLETRTLYRHEQFAMGRCKGCGLIRQNPRLTEAYLRQADYDGHAQERETFWGRPLDTTGLEEWQPKPLAAYEAGVAAVDGVRNCEQPRGRWIDVGASTGSLLVAARNAGYDPAGVELGRGQVRVCQEVHGIDVFHGTFREAAFGTDAASVISWRHVLEHIHDVRAELAEARRVLRPDGHLLIEVPHWAGFKYQFGRVRSALGFSRRFWSGLNVPEHLYYFTVGGLRRLLALEDFEIATWQTYGKYRRNPGLGRRLRFAVRDGLKIGNKVRVVARRAGGVAPTT